MDDYTDNEKKKRRAIYSHVVDRVRKLEEWHNIGQYMSRVRENAASPREIGAIIRAECKALVDRADPSIRSHAAWMYEHWADIIRLLAEKIDQPTLIGAPLRDQCRALVKFAGSSPRTIRNHFEKLIGDTEKAPEAA